MEQQITLSFESFFSILSFFLSFWWIFLPWMLFRLTYMMMLNYTQSKSRLGIKWVLLEIKIPKEVLKSPKAMEQVFASLHGIYSTPVKWHEALFKGKMLHWYSFEMVGKAGETHFYVRTFDEYRNLVESQIYAQYPESEIVEVPDYVNEMPLYLPDDQYDLWGTDLVLSKPDVFPIRTYPAFEEKSAPGKDEPKRIDPLASLSELFNTLHANEKVWIQIIAAPTGNGWVKKGQAALDELMGKKPPIPKSGFFSNMVFALDRALTGSVASAEDEKKPDISPGKHEIMKTIEASWDKPGYECVIRFLYIGPKDNFHKAHAYGVSGAFRQFSSQNLNGFKANMFTITYVKRGPFKKSKLFMRKRAIYQSYKERKPAFMKYVLTTEELATIYHLPDVGVKSPLLPRVEAKKGEPPIGLPIM